MSLPALANLSISGSYQYNESPAKVRTFDVGDSGAKLFTLDDDENIRVHALSPAYDVSSATAGSLGAFFGLWSTHVRTRFKADGTKALTLEDNGANQRNTFLTPWDVTDIDAARAESDFDSASGDTATATPRRGLAVGAGGSTYVVANPTGGYLCQYDTTAPWEPAPMTLVAEVDLAASPHNIAGIDVHDMDFNSDDTSLVVVDVGNGQLHHFSLASPGDITDMSLSDSFDYTGETPAGITVEWVQIAVADNDEHIYVGFIADTAADDSTIQRYSFPALTSVRAAHTASVPLRVAAAHMARFSLRLAAAHATYTPLRVARSHAATIHQHVRAAHTALVPLMVPVRASHTARVPLLQFTAVRAAHTAAIPLRVGRGHTARAPLMAFVRRAHRTVFDLRTSVRAAHAARMPLLDHNPVRRAHHAVFSLLRAPRTHLSMDVSLTAGGRRIPILTWDLRAQEGGYLYEGTVTVGAEGYGLVRVGDAVTLDLFGEPYSLVVESRRRDREGAAGRRFALELRSPTVRFDFPRAAPVTRTFDASVMARAAVETLLGEAVAGWDLVDWRIPAFRLAFEDASPIAAAQEIVQAPGGTIETDPDGTLRVRHLYPSSPKHGYADVAPARTVDDQDDVVSSSESFEPRRRVDRLTIRDTVEGLFNDRLEFEPDANNSRSGTLRVYPSPWRSGLVVRHTSNAALSLTPNGETTREETEVVEFAAGRAGLRFPVEALLALEWLYVSLGAVTFEAHETELKAGGEQGYSLARVTYRVRSIDYRVASATVDEAQLILEDAA